MARVSPVNDVRACRRSGLSRYSEQDRRPIPYRDFAGTDAGSRNPNLYSRKSWNSAAAKMKTVDRTRFGNERYQ